MYGCPGRLHRLPTPRRECARNPVGDVDPMSIDVRIDNHSELPLEHWQDQIKRRRRRIEPRPGPPETPESPGRPPPDALIDEYAAPYPD
jgi:hypothetical protein